MMRTSNMTLKTQKLVIKNEVCGNWEWVYKQISFLKIMV